MAITIPRFLESLGQIGLLPQAEIESIRAASAEGQDWSDLIKAHGPMSLSQAIACAIQAARGLEHAHVDRKMVAKRPDQRYNGDRQGLESIRGIWAIVKL